MILRLDHFAFAVWDVRPSAGFWGELLGGECVESMADYHGFDFLQYAWPAGGRIELLSPAQDDPGHFLTRFLRQYGEGPHHMTFLVDDLHQEVARLRAAGTRVMGEDYSNPEWMEAFIAAPEGRTRFLVQLAQTNVPEAEMDSAWRQVPQGRVLELAAERRGA